MDFVSLFKKYRFQIIVVTIIAVILFIIYLLLSRGEELESIPSPFYGEYSYDIVIATGVKSYDESEPIFDSKSISESKLKAIIAGLGIDLGSTITDNDQIKTWEISSGSVMYNKFENFISLNLDKAIDVDVPMESTVQEDNAQGYFLDFYDKYLVDLPDLTVTSVREQNGNVFVSAVYTEVGYDANIASVTCGNCAIKAEFTEFGDLKSLWFLAISDISYYESLPTISTEEISQYISLKSFPKKIIYEINSDDYDDLPVSVRTSLSITNIELEQSNKYWYYVDSKYSYIVPAYSLDGTAYFEGSFSNVAQGTVNVVFCAVHPDLMYKRSDLNFIDEKELDKGYDLSNNDVESDDENLLFDTVGTDEQ
ncbi:hypothetical protein JW887_06780 [Candidatus Dojkabacteria bacterium]|nr:hypothetical protein [Candidatus Dojkabacteria bacterium]